MACANYYHIVLRKHTIYFIQPKTGAAIRERKPVFTCQAGKAKYIRQIFKAQK